MNSIITKGMARKPNQLITQGYGRTLIVVKGKTGFPIPYIPYKEIFEKEKLLSHIKTKKIKLPNEKSEIEVDVLLINYTGDISVEAYLKEVFPEYDEIKVFIEGEVKIYD